MTVYFIKVLERVTFEFEQKDSNDVILWFENLKHSFCLDEFRSRPDFFWLDDI